MFRQMRRSKFKSSTLNPDSKQTLMHQEAGIFPTLQLNATGPESENWKGCVCVCLCVHVHHHSLYENHFLVMVMKEIFKEMCVFVIISPTVPVVIC